MTDDSTFHCSRCGKDKPIMRDGGTGYAALADGSCHCYACCALDDAESMARTGRATLYLVRSPRGYTLTNWPATLKIDVLRYTTGRHNLAAVRYDVWFAFDGARWHGTTFGDNTMLCHCRRAKAR